MKYAPLLTLLAAPALCATSNVEPDALIEPRIKTYNDGVNSQLLSYDFSCLAQAPNRGYVAHQLADTYIFAPRVRRGEQAPAAYAHFGSYAKAQEELLKALAAARYDSAEAQNQLWQDTLAAQAQLETRYPQAAQRLTNLVALVQSTWQKEQDLPAEQRAKNFIANEKKEDAHALKYGLVRFHQHSPAMQDFLHEYIYSALEAEIKLYSLDKELLKKDGYLGEQSIRDELRIVSSLDKSRLSESKQKDFEAYIAALRETVAILDKISPQKLRELAINSIELKYKDLIERMQKYHRSSVLSSMLDFYQLHDYYYYLATLKSNSDKTPPLVRVNRFILEAIKEKRRK